MGSSLLWLIEQLWVSRARQLHVEVLGLDKLLDGNGFRAGDHPVDLTSSAAKIDTGAHRRAIHGKPSRSTFLPGDPLCVDPRVCGAALGARAFFEDLCGPVPISL